MAKLHLQFFTSLLLIFALICASYPSIAHSQPIDGNGQPVETLPSDAILSEYSTVIDNADRVHEDLTVLGFVTPWNRRGEEVTMTQAARTPSRLDIVSPVTYQFKLNGLHGGHDYSPAFYKNLKESSPSTLIMPRVMFEQNRTPDKKPSSIYKTDNVVQVIVNEWKKYGFDGVVLEMWETVMPLNDKSYDILRLLALKLREQGLTTALVIPPFNADVPQMNVSSVNIHKLADSFSFFVVMTYDYSTPHTDIGPIAPLPWVKKVINYFVNECGLGRRVLMGLNFYGVDFGEKDGKDSAKHEHIVGNQVLDVIREHQPDWAWHEQAQEHFFQYVSAEGGKRVVFYPTRQSIRARVELAEEMECGGVAIWDVGQGLDHFFEEM